MAPSPLHEVAEFVKNRARLMVTKAPKEAPILLIAVIALAVIVLLLYALAIKLDVSAGV